MSSKRSGRWRSWLTKLKTRVPTVEVTSQAESTTPPTVEQTVLRNPVENYYRHRLQSNLATFSRFALQSRSLIIRDVFAKVASYGRENLAELLAVLEDHAQRGLARHELSEIAIVYDKHILLALADLLANSARNDLDTHAALQIYDFAYAVFGDEAFHEDQKLQYVEALGEASRYDDLEPLVEEFNIRDIAPLQAELLNIQRVRNSLSSADAWLTAMNELYDSLDMAPIELSDDETLPLLDRLQASTQERVAGPKVSVIVPTYSPGQGIQTAIRSLLEQTWQNLEIIIVDDASPDEHQGLFSELEDLDPRIQVIRQAQNAGAYVARNTGLAKATGDYVTIHDDDDWSHPDKIAHQVSVLMQDETVVASTSAHIRTTQDMVFRRMNKRAVYMQLNYSSLMFRKSLTDQIGAWDTVNRSGDGEFLLRIIANFGASSIYDVVDKPLSFSRVWAGSLTSGEMARGFHAHSRLLYRWAFRQWHQYEVKKGKRAIRNSGAPRPFPVPTTYEPGDRNKDLGIFDVIYVIDYSRQAKFVDFVLKELSSLVNHGYRIGFMHLPSPQTNKSNAMPQKLFDLQLDGAITQVSQDNVAETKLLVVYDPAIGMFLDEIKSAVKSRRGIVVSHETPDLVGAERRAPILLGQAIDHLDKCFHTAFQVVGATRNDQERIRQQLPAGRLLPDSLIWHNHLTESPGVIAAPESTPTVGFHSYGNRYRWPSSATAFENAYISPMFKTRVYGNVGPARQKFGDAALGQIEVVDIKDQNEQEFLSGIDFWVYYPDERLRDQPWRPVLTAMQAGKVVILPHCLQTIYGSGAVYSDPTDVSDVVARFASDSQAYIAQARRGQELIAEAYTLQHLTDRVHVLIGSN